MKGKTLCSTWSLEGVEKCDSGMKGSPRVIQFKHFMVLDITYCSIYCPEGLMHWGKHPQNYNLQVAHL